MSFVLLKLISLVRPLRVQVGSEGQGLDIGEHGEEAYLHVGGATATVIGSSPSPKSTGFVPARNEA
jgi:hypothetical protein